MKQVENLFNHYYLFQETKKADNWLHLVKKIGNYQPLENLNNMTKKVIIQSIDIYLHIPKGGKLRMTKSLHKEQIGLWKQENNDTIITISNFAKKTFEFFVSENTKKADLFIYELITQEELSFEFSIMRERAYSLS